MGVGKDQLTTLSNKVFIWNKVFLTVASDNGDVSRMERIDPTISSFNFYYMPFWWSGLEANNPTD